MRVLRFDSSPSFRRDGAGQLVSSKVQTFEFAQAAQFGRNLAIEVVADEVDFDYPAFVVRLDAVPVGQRRVREPVVVVGPVRAVCRVVERPERCQFGPDDGQREVAGGAACVRRRFDDVVSGIKSNTDS